MPSLDDAIVLMPSFGSCPVRRANEALVVAHYAREYALPVALGTGASRCHAVNDAARRALKQHPERDVFIIADNDLIPDPASFPASVALAREHAAVCPHDLTRLTTPLGRSRWEHGLEPDPSELTQVGSRSFVVLTRDAFARVNGMDELFIGWGPEDIAFVRSLQKQVGPVLLVDGVRLHLWHPVDPTKHDSGSLIKNRHRARLYKRADGPEAARLAREYGRWHDERAASA
jgi:GT2 family glycosyltransferase